MISLISLLMKRCFLCLQSGEKKKDDETVDSLGEDLSVWAKNGLKVHFAPLSLKHVYVLCDSRSS